MNILFFFLNFSINAFIYILVHFFCYCKCVFSVLLRIYRSRALLSYKVFKFLTFSNWCQNFLFMFLHNLFLFSLLKTSPLTSYYTNRWSFLLFKYQNLSLWNGLSLCVCVCVCVHACLCENVCKNQWLLMLSIFIFFLFTSVYFCSKIPIPQNFYSFVFSELSSLISCMN